MRTTLTLDDDVAAKLKAEARRSGQSFREVVNTLLRQAMTGNRGPTHVPRFRVKARSLGQIRPGLSLDNVSEIIEHIEGSEAR